MTRLPIIFFVALIGALSMSTEAFTTNTIQKQSTFVSRSRVFMAGDDDIVRDKTPTIPTVERGVSIDQDGKSNVWAIEPKVEVDIKSAEEKGASALFAFGGFAAFAVAAGFILTNLPDPDQF